MSTSTIVLGIILIVVAVFLTIAVLMQQGKSHNLSGTIAGGAETFFGKSKAQTINKKLSVLTSVVAIIFVLIVVAFYVMQPNTTGYSSLGDYLTGNKTETTVTADTTSAEEADAETTAADSTANG